MKPERRQEPQRPGRRPDDPIMELARALARQAAREEYARQQAAAAAEADGHNDA